MENKSLDTLKNINTALSGESAKAEVVKIDDPVNAIENSLSDFVRHSFKCVEENRDFEKEIQNQISSRLPEANFAQLIKLLEVTNAGNAVDTATLINPFAAASVAKQAADSEAAKSGSKASDQVYQAASKDILQGITQLNQLLETVSGKAVTSETPTAESAPKEPDSEQ